MSLRCNHNDQELKCAPGSNVPNNSTSVSSASSSSHHRSQQSSVDRGDQREHQVKLLSPSASAAVSASSAVIVTSTATGTITSTSSTYSCSSCSCSCCTPCAGNGNNNGSNNNNFHRARRRPGEPAVGPCKHSMAQITNDNDGYYEVENSHAHHHYLDSQVTPKQQKQLSANASPVDIINTQFNRDICNCDYKNASSSKCNDCSRDKHVNLNDDTKYDDTNGGNDKNVPSNDTLDIEMKNYDRKSHSNTATGESNTESLDIVDDMKLKCNITSGKSVLSNVKNSGNISCDAPEGLSFTPSPEILFLVREHAKTLKTLSGISKRLEQLESKVCDIQKTVINTNTMQVSSSSCNLPCASANCSDLHCKVSSKCCLRESGDNVTAVNKKHLGNNGILSDDSGGEYSRTTNGTVADEDELISLLDQIAKCSQQIRDTQANQVAVANHYLAMSNGNSLQGTSKESSQATLVSDTRQHSILLPHVNSSAMSNNSYVCSNSNTVSSQSQVQRHHVHLANHIVSSSTPVASSSIPRHHSAGRLSHSHVTGLLPHKVNMSDNCDKRAHEEHQHQQMHCASNSSGHLNASSNALHHTLESTPQTLNHSRNLNTNNSSPLSALLFDPNISNVLSNLQDELTNDNVVTYNNACSFLNPMAMNGNNFTRRYTVADIGFTDCNESGHRNGITGNCHSPLHASSDGHLHQMSTGYTHDGNIQSTHRSSLCNNSCNSTNCSHLNHYAKNNSIYHLTNSKASTHCSSHSSPPFTGSVNTCRMPSTASQQQHVSPAFVSTSSHLVHKSQQVHQEPHNTRQMLLLPPPPPPPPPLLPPPPPPAPSQENSNALTSVSLQRQSNDNFYSHGDVAASHVDPADDGNVKKIRSTSVNRVSSSSSACSSSTSSSSSCNNINNSHLDALKFDHARQFVQQRERDELKIAYDAADEWLAKYKSRAARFARVSSSVNCNSTVTTVNVTNVTAASTPTTGTITNSTSCALLTPSSSSSHSNAPASSLRGRMQHLQSSSSSSHETHEEST